MTYSEMGYFIDRIRDNHTGAVVNWDASRISIYYKEANQPYLFLGTISILDSSYEEALAKFHTLFNPLDDSV